MRRLWEHICAFVLALMAGAVFLLAFYEPSRSWPAELLVRDDRPEKGADAILLLMGNAADRVPHAAKLWREGYAPNIVLVESEKTKLSQLGLVPSDGEIAFQFLLRLKVPKEHIIFDRKSNASSTIEEADAIYSLVKQALPEAKRLIITTSWYHSSRAHWILARRNRHGFDLESQPSPTPRQWFEREEAFLNVFQEYLKWPFYLWHYSL